MPAGRSFESGLPQGRVVLIARGADVRCAVERGAGAVDPYPSAIEAVLSVAQRETRAVIVHFADVAGGERELLSALRRARPETPVYFLVSPEDEPVARTLVREGATDYFIVPGGLAPLFAALDAAVAVQTT